MFIPLLYLCYFLSGSVLIYRPWAELDLAVFVGQQQWTKSSPFLLIWALPASSENNVFDLENPGEGLIKSGIIMGRGGIFNWGEQKNIKLWKSPCIFSTQCVSATDWSKGLRSKVRFYTISSVIDSKLAFLLLICLWGGFIRVSALSPWWMLTSDHVIDSGQCPLCWLGCGDSGLGTPIFDGDGTITTLVGLSVITEYNPSHHPSLSQSLCPLYSSFNMS